jgi:hypothetical protein
MSNLYLTTADKLQVINSAAVTVDVAVFFRDVYNPTAVQALAPQPYLSAVPGAGGRQVTAITTGATIDILAAPTDPNSVRVVDTILITNKHATDPTNVTPVFNTGTAYRMYGTITLQAGQSLLWSTSTGWVPPAATFLELLKVLAADDTLVNQNTVQPWFPTAGGITVRGLTTYHMTGRLSLTCVGGTTHTTGLSFTGTATLTAIDYWAQLFSPATAGAIITTLSSIRVAVATNTVLNATSTALETDILVNGFVRINGAGTFIPNLTFSSDPTGALAVKRGSYFSLRQLPGDNTLNSVGAWA